MDIIWWYGVLLFPEVESACSRCHEDVSVLRKMTYTPQSRAFVCLTGGGGGGEEGEEDGEGEEEGKRERGREGGGGGEGEGEGKGERGRGEEK